MTGNDMRRPCECPTELHALEGFPLAMAYVRWQKLDRMYQPELALVRGTLFPELDKPFCGRTVTGGRR